MAAEQKYYDGTGGLHPFEAGFPWAALSEAELNRLRRGVQAMDSQGMEKTKAELKAQFCTPEVGELAPHVLPQLIWPSRDPELFLKRYGVKLLDPKWLTTPVPRPAVPDTKRMGLNVNVLAEAELRQRGVQLGAAMREQLEKVLADPNRKKPEKVVRLMQTIGYNLDGVPGVNGREILQALGSVQAWEMMDGARGVNLTKLGLIEQVSQAVVVMSQVHRAKAGELAKFLVNLCYEDNLNCGLSILAPPGGGQPFKSRRGHGAKYNKPDRGVKYEEPTETGELNPWSDGSTVFKPGSETSGRYPPQHISILQETEKPHLPAPKGAHRGKHPRPPPKIWNTLPDNPPPQTENLPGPP
jgi:hypothetical protein